jgi:DnaJ-class molecular chaperone
MTEEHKNYYEILETPYNSSFELLKENYTKARNAYSSDSLALYSLLSDEECSRVLETIDEAYSILSDSSKRKLYDEAKGIKTEIKDSNESDTNITKSEKSTPKVSMNKILSSNVFSLDFKTIPEMEKEIEQCTEFSGEFLQKVREYKNVDIKRMADLTKVSKTYIKYIEEENFAGLPATVYIRGFVYQYAKTLKLNPELVATSYLRKVKANRDTN